MPVLHDVSFTARPGPPRRSWAAPGRQVDAGVVDLPALRRDRGHDLVDGIDVRDQATEELWSGIGLVLTRLPVLRHGGRQPAVWARGATDDDMWEALRVARADDFVRAPPDGLGMRWPRRGQLLRRPASTARDRACGDPAPPVSICSTTRCPRSTYTTDAAVRANLRQMAADSTVIICGTTGFDGVHAETSDRPGQRSRGGGKAITRRCWTKPDLRPVRRVANRRSGWWENNGERPDARCAAHATGSGGRSRGFPVWGVCCAGSRHSAD